MQKQDFSNNDNKPKMPKFNMNWLYVMILIALCVTFFTDGGSSLLSGSGNINKVSYSAFKAYVDRGYASKVVINKPENYLHMYVYGRNVRDVFKKSTKEMGRDPYVEVEIGSVDQVEDFLNAKQTEGKFKGDVAYDNEKSGGIMSFLLNIAPLAFFIFIWLFFMGRMGGGGGIGGGVFSVGKSKARVYGKENSVGVTFKDVAGQIGAKQEVQEIVEFLKNPAKYTDLGGKIPKGALLVGPPGTGKTLLAKAVAGEAGVPFFSMSGSDFVEMFVGVGASRVRDTFRQAKEKSPCIIFIDEIDAVGRARSKNPSMGGNDERENTLNALLTEMDGFGTNSGVIILAATNRVDMLDKALLRAGRFDRQIHVDLPDLTERKEIFQVHLKPIKVEESLDIDMLARQTPGFSGADIANVCNEAALIAARHDSKVVSRQDFLDAVDRIIGGLEKRSKVITTEEKRTIAYHESGHASVSWQLRWGQPLVKVTIVPRGKALGAAWYLPEERQITTYEQMFDEITSLVAGRAAEEIVFGQISTGALNDLERATKMAFSLVAYYGMSPKIGNISYYDSTGQSEWNFTKPFSEHTNETIDSEVKRMVEEAYQRAKSIILASRDKLDELANVLFEREVIFREDVENIFGPREWDKKDENQNENQNENENENQNENQNQNENPTE